MIGAWTEDELRRIGETLAQTSRQARISAGGVERDVTIEDGDESVLDAVDAGYRDKYGSYASIVDSITDAEHRATTVRLVKE